MDTLSVVVRQRGGDRIAGWVVGTVAFSHGPLHHRTDAPPDAPGGLGLLGNDGDRLRWIGRLTAA